MICVDVGGEKKIRQVWQDVWNIYTIPSLARTSVGPFFRCVLRRSPLSEKPRIVIKRVLWLVCDDQCTNKQINWLTFFNNAELGMSHFYGHWNWCQSPGEQGWWPVTTSLVRQSRSRYIRPRTLNNSRVISNITSSSLRARMITPLTTHPNSLALRNLTSHDQRHLCICGYTRTHWNQVLHENADLETRDSTVSPWLSKW